MQSDHLSHTPPIDGVSLRDARLEYQTRDKVVVAPKPMLLLVYVGVGLATCEDGRW